MGVAEGDRYAAPGPPGAGRIADQRWPQDDQYWQNGTTPGGAVRDRLGAQDIQVASISYSLNPNSGYNANVDGRPGATIGSTVANANNGMQWTFPSMAVNVSRRALGASTVPPDTSSAEVIRCARIMMIARFVNPAGALANNVDNGMEWTTAGNTLLADGRICMMGTPGIGFRVHDVNSVQAIVRGQQAGALLQQSLLTAANGYRCADWNTYEIRIIGTAGGTQNAYAKWLINGKLLFTKFWDSVNGMPETNVNYSGLTPVLVTTGGSGVGFTVNRLFYHASSTEEGLL